MKLKTIQEFLDKLGLTNTFTGSQIVTRDKIENMIEYLQENRKQLHMTFEVEDHSKRKEIQTRY